MKKTIKMLAVLLISVLCLSGCFMPKPMYEQADADQVTAAGREMMLAWLAEHMPDAELTDCAAFIVMPLNTRGEYLTDYAQGYIRTDEGNTEFMINTVSGAVYLGTDSETQKKLNEAAEAYIEELTGLVTDKTENHYFLCTTMVPARDGDSVNEIPGVEFFGSHWFGVYMLPANTDTENLDAFVRDPSSRPMLEVYGEFFLPEGADSSGFDLDAIKTQLKEEHGLQIKSMLILGENKATTEGETAQ